MTHGERFTVEQFLAAIGGSGGLITLIAKRLGCEWHTVKRRIERSPTLQRAYDAERNSIDDKAEAVIIKSIHDGDIDSSWKWIRARRRKEFGDSVDVTTGGEPVMIKVVYENKRPTTIPGDIADTTSKAD